MDTHESSDCCHDVVKVVKLEQDQNKIPVVHTASISKFSNSPISISSRAFENTDGQRHFHNHSPPLLSEQDTYLQNNVFRI
jgi:hypothetical protein